MSNSTLIADCNMQQQVTDYHERLHILRAAAAISDPGYGVWAYAVWAAHNVAYFHGELTPVPIQWGLTPHGHALGYYSNEFKRITLHTSLIRPRGNAWGIGVLLGERFASDVLLHEMIHQSTDQHLGITRPKAGGSSHNWSGWTDEISRVAPLLGMSIKAKPVKQKRIDKQPRWTPEPGCLSQKELSTWPHSVRPTGFYEPEAGEQLAVVLKGGAV